MKFIELIIYSIILVKISHISSIRINKKNSNYFDGLTMSSICYEPGMDSEKNCHPGLTCMRHPLGRGFEKYCLEKTAKEFNKEFLGHLPLHQDLRSSADKGDPLTHSDPDHEIYKLFK